MSKTNPFAGLLAGFRGARAEENDTDEEARKARRAEEDKKREEEDARRAEEDERRQEEDARRAEEDGTPAEDENASAEEDEDQDPEADASDDDDDAEEGMDDKESKAFRRGLAEGRRRESVRGARIFLSPGAAGRPDLAATLAFTTRNTSAEAGRLMSTASKNPVAPKARGRTLDERMGSRQEPRPGGGGGLSGKASFGERVANAVKKAGRGD